MKLWSERGALCPLRCREGLGALGKLLLEGFNKTLAAEVLVPQHSELLMLVIQVGQKQVVVAVDGEGEQF
jgi:hypothetical protein